MCTLRTVIFGSLLLEIVLHLSLALAQPSGFISIDCGSKEESYVDSDTGITYTSDFNLMKSGEIKVVSYDYAEGFPKYLGHLRTFPEGKRNCYALQPVAPGSKYLIRPQFLYGNFDGLNSFPQFDLYLENTFVQTVNASVSGWQEYEFIVKATRGYLVGISYSSRTPTPRQCLLCDSLHQQQERSSKRKMKKSRKTQKTNERDPFISAIELRPLPGDAIYPVVNATLALNTLFRINFGSRNGQFYRYPDDDFDRFWLSPASNGLASINTSLDISLENDPYKPPLKVMQMAVINPDSTGGISWGPTASVPPFSYFFMCIHFAELKKLEANETREFEIKLDKGNFYGPMRPSYLKATYVCSPDIYTTQNLPLVDFNPTTQSTLSPILNAAELYTVIQLSSTLATDDRDASSLLDIRDKYEVAKPWTGDPCLPLNYPWEGLVCSNDTSTPRVISLDLSNSGLSGEIPTSLANLTAIVSLNLAGNNLTGSIPDFFANLTLLRDLYLAGNSLTGSIPDFFLGLVHLRVLDLSDNNLNGSVPDALLNRKRDGSLTLRGCDVRPKKSSQGIIIGLSVSAAILFVLVASSIIVLKTKKRQPAQTVEKWSGSQAFTFSEVVQMTDNFKQKIGGGYGPVFYGYLCGQDVAVKVLSDKSKQGSKEFYNEIALLSRVHHRNLVSFLGYCDEAESMILIYEYLPKGNLREVLSGSTQVSLGWNQRLLIALDAAQGLEYLHSGCKPAIIHRDVKSANILLNGNLEAKLADFGVSKSGMPDGFSHISTAVVGTPGYLDPEYYSTNWLNEKSDIYSFGVILLELISGQQPVMVDPSGTRIHVVEWARRHLVKGNHEKVADPNLEGRYNVPSFWRVADTALQCTTDKGMTRPSMKNVVNELEEAIAMCHNVWNSDISNSVVQQKSEACASSYKNPLVDEEIEAIYPAPR